MTSKRPCPGGVLFFICILFLSLFGQPEGWADDGQRIRPWPENPYYWQFQGQPVLLLGGSWQDNLFNHPIGLPEHLDLLKSVGGNYVRNVMSHRNQGNVFAYPQVDGKFDLDRWNEEYWERFERFLQWTQQRQIVVQIEIWATWDLYEDHQSLGGWSKHPFNPQNNRNYTAEESGLPTEVSYPPTGRPTAHGFFRSIPALDHHPRVLQYQTAFVDRLLKHSLPFPHVLYCLNNETGEEPAWGDHWARHIRQRAAEADLEVHVTDMRRNESIRAEDHLHIFSNPQLYSFVDISQNNAWEGLGQRHYDNLMYVRQQLADQPRPINNVKNYGATRHGRQESVARFCRIVFAGAASARFHRPHPLEDPGDHQKESEFGLGLSPLAQSVIASLRSVDQAVKVPQCRPANDLLADRQENQAYCLAREGVAYAVYFPDGGEVKLDLSAAEGRFQLRWVEIATNQWQEPTTVLAGGELVLRAPGTGHWVAVLTL